MHTQRYPLPCPCHLCPSKDARNCYKEVHNINFATMMCDECLDAWCSSDEVRRIERSRTTDPQTIKSALYHAFRRWREERREAFIDARPAVPLQKQLGS